MRTRFIRLGIVMFLAPACSSDAPAPGNPDTALIGARIFDGRQMRSQTTVMIRGGTIVDVTDGAPEGVRRIDLGDVTLMPGVVDTHVHLAAMGSYDTLTQMGVTTVRDLGVYMSALPLRKEGPGGLRILYAGPLIGPRKGFAEDFLPGATENVETPAEARALVDELVELEVDAIKLYLERGAEKDFPLLRPDVARAVVDAAHAADLPAVAHVTDATEVKAALDAGVDEFAHVPCQRLSDELVDRVVTRGVTISSTLHVRQPPTCRGVMGNARRLLTAGARIVYGSDLGTGIPFGIDPTELQLLVDAGMTETDALAAATSEAATSLGLDPLGSVVAGAPADLVAVAGDPTSDFAVLERPVFEMVRGDVVHRDDGTPGQ